MCFQLPGIQNSIYNDMSWPLKLKLLKDYQPKTSKPPVFRRVGLQAYKMEKVLREDEETTTEQIVMAPIVQKDETNMKMKLFRLMYETIRDSDVKIKRAEVIKKHYANSTSFNIGYIMGEITERFNVMTDISVTLKRLYNEWKPMEHINAYEQIANKAVEVSHLVDAARSLGKREDRHAKRRH